MEKLIKALQAEIADLQKEAAKHKDMSPAELQGYVTRILLLNSQIKDLQEIK